MLRFLERASRAEVLSIGLGIMILAANFAWDYWRAAAEPKSDLPEWPAFVFLSIVIAGFLWIIMGAFRLPPFDRTLSPDGREFAVLLKHPPRPGPVLDQSGMIFPDVWVINRRPERSTILEFAAEFTWLDVLSGSQRQQRLTFDEFFRFYRERHTQLSPAFHANPMDIEGNRLRDLAFLTKLAIPDEAAFAVYVKEVQTGVTHRLTEIGKLYEIRCEPEETTTARPERVAPRTGP